MKALIPRIRPSKHSNLKKNCQQVTLDEHGLQTSNQHLINAALCPPHVIPEKPRISVNGTDKWPDLIDCRPYVKIICRSHRKKILGPRVGAKILPRSQNSTKVLRPCIPADHTLSCPLLSGKLLSLTMLKGYLL